MTTFPIPTKGVPPYVITKVARINMIMVFGPAAGINNLGEAYMPLNSAAVTGITAYWSNKGDNIVLNTFPAPMAVTPALLIVTSPDIGTPVATFDALPTNILPLDNVELKLPPSVKLIKVLLIASCVKNPSPLR